MSKAAATRLTILQKAFELIYKNGYQATSIDDIIATTQVTKGAFFYHFKNKEEMGLAMINEVMRPGMLPFMKDALQKTGDVRTDLYDMMKGLLLLNPFFKVEYGCPAINLIEEMAPLNQTFKTALAGLTAEWQQTIEQAFAQAQAAGQLSRQHNPRQIALYVASNYGGIRNMGKILGRDSYTAFLQEFKNYLQGLA